MMASWELGDGDCWAATPGCERANREDGGSIMSRFYEQIEWKKHKKLQQECGQKFNNIKISHFVWV